MPDYVRAFSFKTDGGVRVFGDPEDRIVMAPGIEPSGVVPVLLPAHEFAKIDSLIDLTGDVELWFRESPPDGLPDVTLKGWQMVPRIDETIRGFASTSVGIDYDTPEIHERRIYLADKRWRMCHDRANALTIRANRSDAQGKIVRADPRETKRTCQEIANAIAGALRAEISVIDGSLGQIPPPRDIDWRMADPVEEWKRFEAYTGHILVLLADGTFAVRKPGSGDAPDLPDATWELHSESYTLDASGARRVLFTSAPNRIIDEIRLTMEHFEYVGRETDGDIKPIAALSYAVADWPAEIRVEFKDLKDEAKHLAYVSIGCLLRLKHTYKDYLPFLAERVTTVNEEAACVRIAHAGAHPQAGKGKIVQGDTALEVSGARFDPRTGLVMLPYPAWKVTEGTEDADEWYEGFDRFLLTSNEFEVIVGHEKQLGESSDFFIVAYDVNAQGTVNPFLPAESALGMPGTRIVRMEHWTPKVLDGVMVNEDDMKSEARATAQEMMTGQTTSTRTRVYKGFHHVDCGARVSEVVWDFDKATTTVKYDAFQLPSSQHAQAARSAAGIGGTLGGSSSRQAVVRQAGRDARMGASYAAPPVAVGFGAAVHPMGSAAVKSFIAVIAGSEAEGDNRWAYAWCEKVKAAAGYGPAVFGSPGNPRSGTTTTDAARNLLENMNSAAGVQGNGVDVAHLDTDDYTFEIQPCPEGAMVVMYQLTWASGAEKLTEYWFQYANGVDGECDE